MICITPPLNSGDHGPAVGNLQEGLLLLLENGLAQSQRWPRSGDLGEMNQYTGFESRVYQLVDVGREPWRIGETVDVRTRLNEHARIFGRIFRGMQIVSEPMAKPNALALEESLGERLGVSTLSRESSSMYKMGGGWMPAEEGIYGAEAYNAPSYTLFNPGYYPWVSRVRRRSLSDSLRFSWSGV